jgi:hypothetical protein
MPLRYKAELSTLPLKRNLCPCGKRICRKCCLQPTSPKKARKILILLFTLYFQIVEGLKDNIAEGPVILDWEASFSACFRGLIRRSISMSHQTLHGQTDGLETASVKQFYVTKSIA